MMRDGLWYQWCEITQPPSSQWTKGIIVITCYQSIESCSIMQYATALVHEYEAKGHCLH